MKVTFIQTEGLRFSTKKPTPLSQHTFENFKGLKIHNLIIQNKFRHKSNDT